MKVLAYYDDSEPTAEEVKTSLQERIAELEAQLVEARKAAEWQPIDAEHLPKVGDEIGIWTRSTRGMWNSHLPREMIWEIRKVWVRDHETYEQWIKVATHYRPINAPQESK
jgi:DNA-binding transcriptional MerR regulator